MATFKAEVYAHQKRADGTYNIKIRVTHKTRKKYLSTPWYVGREDLTRSLKLKNQRYIDMVEAVLRRYRAICNEAGEALDSMDVGQVAELVAGGGRKSFDLDIVAYTRAHIDALTEQGRVGNARLYKVALNSLVKFAGRESVSIKELTVGFLSAWVRWIGEQPPRGNRKKGCRAESSYTAAIRAMYNRAKREFNDEEAGVINIPFSPFERLELPKQPLPRKRALTAAQLRAVAALPYTTILQPGLNRRNFAKDIFLLSFFLIGMNAADLYAATDYRDGRITYQRQKTKNRRADRAEISVRVEPEAQALFDKYRDGTGKRVFNFYRHYSSVDAMSMAINHGLKKIGGEVGVDDLQFYAARHTWATLAANDAGVDKYAVHAALNHVDDAMRVTDIYIRKSWDGIDRANRQVLDLLHLDVGSVAEPVKPKEHRRVSSKARKADGAVGEAE